MATFEGASRPRRSAWPTDDGLGDLDDGFYGPPDRPRRSRGARPDSGSGGSGSDGGSPPRRSILWRWRRIFFLFGLLALAVPAAGIALMARTELPELDELQQSSLVCTADVGPEPCSSSNAMARLSLDEDRVNVRLDDVPEEVVQAVIAAEDRNFYEHTGIDPIGIARALYHDVRAGAVAQGGSTITQQFVKNTYLSHEQSLTRKLEEALLAIRVEQEMSKDEILEGYLNTIYWGRNAYGIGAASQAYFGKPVGELGLAEAAYLAGLIRAPELADAERDRDEAERRRRTVLDAMLDEGYITEEEHTFVDAIPLEPPNVVPREEYRQTRMSADDEAMGMQYVTSYVRTEARRILRDEASIDAERVEAMLENGGLRIYTTVDRNVQRAAYDAVYTNTLNQPGDPAGALVALDNQGQIKALVGGRAEAEGDEEFINFAVAGQGSGGRPVGSTFKPIALAEAVVRNYSLEGSRIPAPATTVIPPGDLPCEPWEVSNYDEEEAPGGNFNLVEATQHSSNTAYGQLMAELTPARVESMARRLGMDSDLSDCLPTVLGADNSTPLEMAEVYSTFANRGVHREPRVVTRIEQVDRDGEVSVLYESQPEERRVLSEQQADLVTHALRKVIEDGTGSAANFGKPAAGKTGTTSSNRDAWFVGYTPSLTASVWVGHPHANWVNPGCLREVEAAEGPAPSPEATQQRVTDCTEIPPMNTDGVPVHDLESVTGGSIPAEIFKRFMEVATGSSNENFAEPAPEQLRGGQEIGGDEYISGTESTAPEATTVPSTVPGPGGGPQPTRPTTPSTQPQPTEPPPTTDTTFPDDTTPSTDITIFPPTSEPTGPPGRP